MKPYKKAAMFYAVSLAAFYILPGAVQAQQPGQAAKKPAQAAAATVIDEVVVTARRREENVQDIPLAVAAFSDEQLDKKQINTPQDLNKLTPGLQLSSANGPRESFQPYIRGQVSVVPYFAEVPSAGGQFPGFQVSYYDLSNLQVIKGAQGTLFGETATGGVLLYTPRKPTGDFNGYLRATAGTYNLTEFEGGIGGALIPDKLFVRLSGQIRKRDGFTKQIRPNLNAPIVDLDNVDRSEYRVSAVFKPVDNVEFYGIYAHSDVRSNGTSQLIFAAPDKVAALKAFGPTLTPQTAAQYEYYTGRAAPAGTWYSLIQDAVARQNALGPRSSLSNYDKHRRVVFDGFIGQAKWDITDYLTVRNIFGISRSKSRGPNLETDGTDLPLLDTIGATVLPGVSPSDGLVPTDNNWSNETQFLGNFFDKRLNLQGGFYYRRLPGKEWSAQQGTIIIFGGEQGAPAPAATCTALAAANPCSTLTRLYSESYATYGQGTFAVTPTINLTAGYRRTTDFKRSETTASQTYFDTFRGFQIPISVAGAKPLPGALITSTVVPRASAGTYTLAADWKFRPGWLTYITTRTGYRGGGINSTQPVDSPFRNFGPERVKDYEAGLKGDFDIMGAHARTNIAIFRTTYSDIQRSTLLSGTALTITRNLAEARIQGVEVEANLQANSYLTLGGFFSYTDGKFVNWLEDTRCASQPFQPVCAGQPSTTLMTIDHAHGVVTAAGNSARFTPDQIAELSKYRYGITPALGLGFLGEQFQTATLSASYYYRSSTPNADVNNSGNIGNLAIVKGYAMADVRFDWRNIRGSEWNFFASATNVFDKTVPIFVGEASNICDCIHTVYSEPRMLLAGFSMKFGN